MDAAADNLGVCECQMLVTGLDHHRPSGPGSNVLSPREDGVVVLDRSVLGVGTPAGVHRGCVLPVLIPGPRASHRTVALCSPPLLVASVLAWTPRVIALLGGYLTKLVLGHILSWAPISLELGEGGKRRGCKVKMKHPRSRAREVQRVIQVAKISERVKCTHPPKIRDVVRGTSHHEHARGGEFRCGVGPFETLPGGCSLSLASPFEALRSAGATYHEPPHLPPHVSGVCSGRRARRLGQAHWHPPGAASSSCGVHSRLRHQLAGSAAPCRRSTASHLCP